MSEPKDARALVPIEPTQADAPDERVTTCADCRYGRGECRCAEYSENTTP